MPKPKTRALSLALPSPSAPPLTLTSQQILSFLPFVSHQSAHFLPTQCHYQVWATFWAHCNNFLTRFLLLVLIPPIHSLCWGDGMISIAFRIKLRPLDDCAFFRLQFCWHYSWVTLTYPLFSIIYSFLQEAFLISCSQIWANSPSNCPVLLP